MGPSGPQRRTLGETPIIGNDGGPPPPPGGPGPFSRIGPYRQPKQPPPDREHTRPRMPKEGHRVEMYSGGPRPPPPTPPPRQPAPAIHNMADPDDAVFDEHMTRREDSEYLSRAYPLETLRAYPPDQPTPPMIPSKVIPEPQTVPNSTGKSKRVKNASTKKERARSRIIRPSNKEEDLAQSVSAAPPPPMPPPPALVQVIDEQPQPNRARSRSKQPRDQPQESIQKVESKQPRRRRPPLVQHHQTAQNKPTHGRPVSAHQHSVAPAPAPIPAQATRRQSTSAQQKDTAATKPEHGRPKNRAASTETINYGEMQGLGQIDQVVERRPHRWLQLKHIQRQTNNPRAQFPRKTNPVKNKRKAAPTRTTSELPPSIILPLAGLELPPEEVPPQGGPQGGPMGVKPSPKKKPNPKRKASNSSNGLPQEKAAEITPKKPRATKGAKSAEAAQAGAPNKMTTKQMAKLLN